MTHSPLPWKLVNSPNDGTDEARNERGEFVPATSILDALGDTVVNNIEYYPERVTPDNQSLIVTAVNAHAALVASSQIGREYLASFIDYWGVDDDHQRAMKADLAKIDAALDLARNGDG